jgi:Cu(I)/Ag(I) efflux system protein CusF
MKTVTLTLLFALFSSNSAFAQTGTGKKADQSPPMNMQQCHDMMDHDGMRNGMDMKGMDMKGMDMKSMDMKGMSVEKCKEMMKAGGAQVGKENAKAITHKAVAVVKKVDQEHGKVTLAHEAVQSLKWPAMTMAFSVKDARLFEKLAAGKKVNVEFAKQGAEYVVTAVK